MQHKLTFVAVLLALGFLTLGVQAEPTAAPDAGACATVSKEVANAEEATLSENGLLPEQPAFLAVPKLAKNNCSLIGGCNRWDSPYCNYSCTGWNCCGAVILISNSYCPTICA